MTEFIWLFAGFVVGCILVYIIESHRRHRQKIENEERLVDLRRALDAKLKAEVEAVKQRIGKTAALDADKKLEALARDLLPLVDAMQMALDMKTQNVDSLKDGVQMIYDRLESTLGKHGCESISPEVGHPYDPSLHQAVSCDGDPECILGVQRVGFRVGDKVIRPAAVDVGRMQSPQMLEEPEEEVVTVASQHRQ